MIEKPSLTLGQEMVLRRTEAAQHRADADALEAAGNSDEAGLNRAIANVHDALAANRADRVARNEGIMAGTIINTITGEVRHPGGSDIVDVTDGGGETPPPTEPTQST